MDKMKKSVVSDKNIIAATMVNGSLEDTEKILSNRIDGVLDSSNKNLPDFEAQSFPDIESSATPSKDENSSSKEASTVCISAMGELKKILKQRLEEIFSQENFSKDKFLISQLDSDQYISLDIIMQLKQIECLTEDADLILELLKELPNLQVDFSNRKVRLASPRSTIILREVPETTPKKDIERLFEGADCPPCVKCEFAGNENWYVTFLTEEDAHRAYNHLRENVQSFLDKPIKARIKTSNTFIPTSGKAASGLGSRFCQSPTLDGLEVLPQHHHSFPSQAQASFLPNYIVPPTLHFYPDLIPTQAVWTQKFVDPYNMSVCSDFLYTQPVYGYPTQDNGTAYEGNPRQHKSTNSVHFRTGNHYQHRSQGEFGSGGGGGFNRYNVHNENRPPPRFLRQQQMASMVESPSNENHGLNFSREGHSPLDKSSSDSRPAQSLISVRHAGNDRHIPNGFAKATASSKSSPEDGYSSRGRRFSERRGGYRGNRRSRISDDGDKSVKNRHQEINLKSPKSKDIPTFSLESSSFPPLSSISNTSAPSASCGTSYVQAVANSSSLANSYQSSQQKLPRAPPCTNSPLTPPSFTASEPHLHQTTNANSDDVNGTSDRGSKMPSVKLSYAQIAQLPKSTPFKNQENDCSEHSSADTKMDRNNDKNPPLSQQQTNLNKKKYQATQSRKNGEHFKGTRISYDEEDKYFKPAKKGDIENGRQFPDKMAAKASMSHSQHNSFDDAREVEGKLVMDGV